jgi:hypothetical protein
MRYANKWNLQQHIARHHARYYPESCLVHGCTQGGFLNYDELSEHMRCSHPAYGLEIMRREHGYACRVSGYKKTYRQANAKGYIGS